MAYYMHTGKYWTLSNKLVGASTQYRWLSLPQTVLENKLKGQRNVECPKYASFIVWLPEPITNQL